MRAQNASKKQNPQVYQSVKAEVTVDYIKSELAIGIRLLDYPLELKAYIGQRTQSNITQVTLSLGCSICIVVVDLAELQQFFSSRDER